MYDPLSSIAPPAAAPLAPPSAPPVAAPAAPPAASSAPPVSQKPAGSSILDRMIGQNDKIADEASKSLGAINAKIMQFKPPEPPKLPPKPAPAQTSLMDAWGSAAMVFAALAPMFVRGHATAAMNAAAAAMKGIQQKDAEQTKYNLDVWKQETQNAIDMSNFQWKSYEALMGNLKFEAGVIKDISAEQRAKIGAEVQTLSFAFQNAGAIEAYKKGDLEGVAEFNQKQKELTSGYQEKTLAIAEKIQELQDRAKARAIMTDPANADKPPEEIAKMLAPYDTQSANLYKGLAAEARQREMEEASVKVQAKRLYDDWLLGEGRDATAEQRLKKLAEIYGQFQSKNGRIYPDPNTLDPETRAAFKGDLAAYNEEWPKITQQRGDFEGWQTLRREIEKENPGWNPSKFALVKNARAKLTLGKDADAVASYVRLNQHLELFDELIQKLPNNGDINAADKLAVWFGRQTGNPNVTSYEAALQLVGDEMVKAATGTGAAGALGDREGIKENFAPGLAKDQLKANVDAVRKLVGGAMISTLGKYRSALSLEETLAITGLSPEMLQKYHVNISELRPTVKGLVQFGSHRVQIDENGATDLTPAVGGAQPGAAPSAGELPKIETKTLSSGKTIYGLNGKWVDAQGNPVLELK